MKLRLHEVEIFSRDTSASRRFYQDLLGLPVRHAQEGLNVLDPGWPGIDFDTSVHHPGKARMTFVVDSLDQYLESIQGKGLKFAGPMKSHLGMRVIRMEDPDGNIVEVQEFSEGTPSVVREAFP